MKIKNINSECVSYIETNEESLSAYYLDSKKKWSIYNRGILLEKYAKEFEYALQDYYREQNLKAENA